MFWKKFFKKRRVKEVSEDEEYTKSLESDYKRRLKELKSEAKLRTLKEKYDFEREKQQLELEKLKLDLIERKANFQEEYEDEGGANINQDLGDFMQMLNMAKSAGIISQKENPNQSENTTQYNEPVDYSQTNDFIKTINNMEPEKFNKLKSMMGRL